MPGTLRNIPVSAVRQVRQHRESLAWWFRVAGEFPGGVVPVPTAARMLGVSSRRMRALIDAGRLRVVEGMPGGTERDRFIPAVDLINGPFVLDRGQPGVWGPESRFSQEFLDREAYNRKRKSRKGLGHQNRRNPSKSADRAAKPRNRP